MLGRLGLRRSSASPAPRTADVGTLPEDVLVTIVTKLARRPPAEAARDIASASVVNKALRAAVATDEHARSCRPLVRNARQLIERLLGGDPDPDPEDARLCVPVLGLLSRREQATLVRVLTSHAAHDTYSWTRRDDPFSEFVPHLAALDQPLRVELVERAIRDELDETTVATAIASLGGGLAHIASPSIDRLVDTATTLSRGRSRAFAIRGLCAGWGHMNGNQRQSLWRAAMELPECRFKAIEGLGAQLKHLLPKQQEQVFEQATSLRIFWQQGMALASLAASIEVLDDRQRQTLIMQGLSLPDDYEGSRSMVVCALAAGVEHMDPRGRIDLVGEITRLKNDTDRGSATAALGPHLKHIPARQQDQLLKAAASWPVHARVVAVQGLAAGLRHMEPDQRRQLGTLVLEMDDDRCMAQAIGALGPHLQHLDTDLRDAIVEQALRLLSHEAGLDPSRHKEVRLLSAGLGAGMEALSEEQRAALVAAALDPRSLQTHERLPAVAAAIAGLAAGRQHLSKDSFAGLVEAASSLETGLRIAAENRVLLQSECMEAQATAIFGLVKA